MNVHIAICVVDGVVGDIVIGCHHCHHPDSVLVVVEDPSPMAIAKAAQRDHVTPEDVGLSIRAGMPALELCLVLLDAIAARKVEDVVTCAFVCATRGRAPMPAAEAPR